MKADMRMLIRFLLRLAKQDTEHHKLCCLAADKFDLWKACRTPDGPSSCRFPIWLSVVAAKVLEDPEAFEDDAADE